MRLSHDGMTGEQKRILLLETLSSIMLKLGDTYQEATEWIDHSDSKSLDLIRQALVHLIQAEFGVRWAADKLHHCRAYKANE